jgi:hypothetical protein
VASARAPPPNLRALMADGGVGQGLEGLVQRRELARDPEQVLVGVEPLVERVHLVAEPVEPLEDGVELAVSEVRSLHSVIVLAAYAVDSLLGRQAASSSGFRLTPARSEHHVSP